jgi:hypothetical protein
MAFKVSKQPQGCLQPTILTFFGILSFALWQYSSPASQRDLLPSYGKDIKQYRAVHRRSDCKIGPAHRLYQPKVLRNALAAFDEKKIEGWMQAGHFQGVFVVTQVQAKAGVCGSVGEIGVHHGMFLSVLGSFTAPEQTIVAIDLFEAKQGENYDSSGNGSLGMVRSNMLSLGLNIGQLKFIVRNSLSLRPSEFNVPGLAPFRIFSVDGGHSFETTINDILLASKLIHDKGVIIVDDVGGVFAEWAGVTDAVFWFLNAQTEVAAFLILEGKVYLCLREEHATYLAAAKSSFSCGRDIHKSRSSIGAATGHASEYCLAKSKAIPPEFETVVDAVLSW